jgi:hypothetical protein
MVIRTLGAVLKPLCRVCGKLLRSKTARGKVVQASKEACDTALVRLLVSELDVRSWQAHLCAAREIGERQVLVTGPIATDGLRVPCRMEDLPLSQQSHAYVQLEHVAMTRRVVELDRTFGHRVLLIAHSHILYGAASIRPSQIDIRNQVRVAALGWKAIGLIFSLDGYARFFDPSRDFEVEICGKGFDVLERTPRNVLLKLHGIAGPKALPTPTEATA